MNLRRYTLFLIVALLTFLIGIASAALFVRVNPFQRAEKTRCGCRRLSSLPGPRKAFTVYTVYRSDGTILRATEVDKASDSDSDVAIPADVEPPPIPPPAPALPRRSR